MARCECATIRHREAKLGQVFCSAKKKSQVFLGEKQLCLLWVMCGRRVFGKNIRHVMQIWLGAVMCSAC